MMNNTEANKYLGQQWLGSDVFLNSSAKVGEVPTFRASDTDTDLPIVSTDLFSGFQYLKNRFIASK
jgi:hypothetical protein